MSKYTLKEAFLNERAPMRPTDLTGDPRSSMTDKDIDASVGSIGAAPEKGGDAMDKPGMTHNLEFDDDDIDGALKGLGESEFNDAALSEPTHGNMEECGMEDPAVNGLSAPVVSDDMGEAGPTELVVIKLGHHDAGMNMGGGDHPSFGAPGGPELEQPIRFESDRWMQLAEIPVINEDAASIFGESSDEPEDDICDDPDLNENQNHPSGAGTRDGSTGSGWGGHGQQFPMDADADRQRTADKVKAKEKQQQQQDYADQDAEWEQGFAKDRKRHASKKAAHDSKLTTRAGKAVKGAAGAVGSAVGGAMDKAKNLFKEDDLNESLSEELDSDELFADAEQTGENPLPQGFPHDKDDDKNESRVVSESNGVPSSMMVLHNETLKNMSTTIINMLQTAGVERSRMMDMFGDTRHDLEKVGEAMIQAYNMGLEDARQDKD